MPSWAKICAFRRRKTLLEAPPRHWKNYQLREITGATVMMGLRDIPEVHRRIYKPDGKRWLYMDHAYFNRWPTYPGRFRLVVNGPHLTYLLDRPADRFEATKTELKPWRKDGGPIIVIPPSSHQRDLYPGCVKWTAETVSRLSQITDRKVHVKDQKGAFEGYMAYHNPWAVVTFCSVAGIHALQLGYPVSSTERCPSWPLSVPLERIETPDYPERMPLFASLAYASYDHNELGRIDWATYDYSLCDDMPQELDC